MVFTYFTAAWVVYFISVVLLVWIAMAFAKRRLFGSGVEK